MTESRRVSALGDDQRDKAFDLLYLAGSVAALGWFVHSRARLGFHSPTPWPDEASFLWQAIAFAEHGSLAAPEIHPERPVHWMPPGYMVLSGLIFKLTGFSFGLARWLSTLYLWGAFACLLGVTRSFAARFGHLALIAVFAQSPIFLFAANVARMEALLLLMVAAGTLLMHRGRHYAGLSIFFLSPLVHPNGLFFAASGIACAAWVRSRGALPRFGRWDLLVIGLVGISWLGYAAYVALSWDAFVADIGVQLTWKRFESQGATGMLGRLSKPLMLVWVTSLAAALAFAAKRRLAVLAPLCATAVASLALSVVMVGWMYEVYPAFGLMIAAVIVLEALAAFIGTALSGTRARGAALAAAALAMVAVSGSIIIYDPHITESVRRSTVFRRTPAPAYFVPEDRAPVVAFLASLRDEPRTARVQFLPDADSLLFHEQRSPGLEFVMHTHHHMPNADVFLFHDSVWLPTFARQTNMLWLAMAQGIPVPVERWSVIHERDRTERWLVYRRPRPW